MVEAFQTTLTTIRDFLGWAPNTIAGGIILLLAALIALFIHSLGTGLLRRLVGSRNPYLAGVLSGTRRQTQLAFLIAALFIALPAAPFDDEVTTALAYALLVAAIVLLGWIAVTAAHIVADLYLRRFQLDTADNLIARKHVTQVRVLRRVVDILIVIVTIGAALMIFEPVRQYGVSLFASAGVAGLVVGLAARPVLSNLIAGIQLAVTQPIRIEDQIIVENESGRVEEITATYVVVRLWDMRRMIVPLSYFIERPFQNWTRESSPLTGTVFVWVDFSTPVAMVRDKAVEIVKASPLWDGNVAKVQVTDASDTAMQLRILASARTSGDAFDLRCEIREKLIDFLQHEHPYALPRTRQEPIAPAGAPIGGREQDTSSPAP